MRLLLCCLAALTLAGCFAKPGLKIKEDQAVAPAAAAAPEPETVVEVAALLPLLNRTEFEEAPLVVGKALADELAAAAPFRLIRPEAVPGLAAPLYELGVIPRLLAEVDQSGRTAPEVARLVGQGLKADALLVANVTFYQQFVDRLPDGAPGEAYTTVVGGEVHLIDARSGRALWKAAKVRRDRGAALQIFPSLQDTARGLAFDLVATLPK
ncbi:MAG: hypothetical protein FJZ01_22680 [Candidatus Sericytochromatia bacterium]|nr:hypothetical protein [Candidatus Tanganyikabacteria bacterium]